jgi:phosphosulfolactate phosphohydrolase-like enzyme
MKNIRIAKDLKDVLSFNGICVIVDFFRFSTTVIALVWRNKYVRVYSDEKKFIDFLKNNNFDVFSEKDFPIKKFDNSPYLALYENIKDNVIVITNSGSKAVLGAKNSEIIIGSLCNISSVKNYLDKKDKEIMIVPACIFFNPLHIEDFLISEFMKDFFEGKNLNLSPIKNEIDRKGRIDELKKLRKTAQEDLEIIFSIDKFDIVPLAFIKGDFAEVYDEKSSYKFIRRT